MPTPPPPPPASTGLPWASSCAITRPVVAAVEPVTPGSKSAWPAEKSRYTTGTSMLSPSGGCRHVNPDSTVHVAEQPSPARLLPSSHTSPLSRMPSPHLPAHTPLAAVHVGSFWQVAEQPSNGLVSPTSQPSAPSFLLSPHRVAWHSVGGLPVHAQPGFQRQRSEHAMRMLATAIPGSHCSVPVKMPSPQSGTHGALTSGQT
jgi:hypothetical protein